MRSLAYGISTLVVAIGLPSFVFAAPPPPPPPHARYGPIVQCIHGYALAAGPFDAVFANGDSAGLVTEALSLSLWVDRPDHYRSEMEATLIDAPNVGRVTRYHRTYRGRTTQTFYTLPTRTDDVVLQVRSIWFDGSVDDLAILARISPVEELDQPCGDFEEPIYPGENPEALWWSPRVGWGPQFHCQNGVGFSVNDGEAIQLQWPSRTQSEGGVSRLWSNGQWLVIHGPRSVSGNLTGLVSGSYSGRIVEWGRRPVLLLEPAGAAADNIPSRQEYRHWIRVEYFGDGEADALTFSRRLEFVATNDPRCNVDSEKV